MRKTSVPAPFGGLMIAGVVVAVAAPFFGLDPPGTGTAHQFLLVYPLHRLHSGGSDPLCPAGRRSAVPVGRFGLAIQPTRKGELTMKKCFSVIAALLCLISLLPTAAFA